MSDIFGQLQQELDRREKGFSLHILSGLPLLERKALNLFLRHGHLSRDEVSHMLEADREVIRPMLDRFVEQKILLEFEREGERRYRPLLAREHDKKKPQSIWAAVRELIE